MIVCYVVYCMSLTLCLRPSPLCVQVGLSHENVPSRPVSLIPASLVLQQTAALHGPYWSDHLCVCLESRSTDLAERLCICVINYGWPWTFDYRKCPRARDKAVRDWSITEPTHCFVPEIWSVTAWSIQFSSCSDALRALALSQLRRLWAVLATSFISSQSFFRTVLENGILTKLK